MVKCPKCGEEEYGNFCRECGTQIKTKCPNCGQTVNVEEAYCGNCGVKNPLLP